MKIPVQQGYVTSDLFFDLDRWWEHGTPVISAYGGVRFAINHSLEKNVGDDFWDWFTD